MNNNKRWLFDPDLEDKMTEIEIKLKQLNIKNYRIGFDKTIDINGNADTGNNAIDKFPFKFGRINGDFTCNLSGVKSLKNFPQIINGNLYCFNNHVLTLAYNEIGYPEVKVSGKCKFTDEYIKTFCKIRGEIFQIQ